MMPAFRVLLIEDSEDDAALIVRELRKIEPSVATQRVETAQELRAALQETPWDLVLSDFALPGFNGFAALKILREGERDIPFIVVSGAVGEAVAVELMRCGASDFVAKDNLLRLGPSIRRELQDAELRRERRAAEAALHVALQEEEAARDKIVNIITSVPDGLLVCDEHNRVVMMNQPAEALLGRSLRDILSQPIRAVFADSALGAHLGELDSAESSGGEAVDLEVPNPGSKHPRIIQAKTSLMLDRSGHRLGSVTILRDITRERELDRIKSEFISMAAHELSTPLTAIIGYVDLLLKADDYGRFSPQEQRSFLEEIQEKGLALSRIVEELLDIGRIETGQGIPLHREPCNLAQLLTRTVAQFELQTVQHRFVFDLSPELPEAFVVDPLKIGEVFENLLSNAIKYSPQGGVIRLSGRLAEGCGHFAVTDEGIGLSPDQLQRIFDKFYRVDASDTSVRGLGLGLNLSRQIVEAHGGRIWVESELGAWTTVNFTLPLLA